MDQIKPFSLIQNKKDIVPDKVKPFSLAQTTAIKRTPTFGTETVSSYSTTAPKNFGLGEKPPVKFEGPKASLPLPDLKTAQSTEATPKRVLGLGEGVVGGIKEVGKAIVNSPQTLSTYVGQPMLQAYGAIGNKLNQGAVAVQRKIAPLLGMNPDDYKTPQDLTPTTQFQKDLYGTDKPLTFGQAGESNFGVSKDNPLAPTLGFLAGALDLLPGGAESKQALKTFVKTIKTLEDVKGARRFLKEAGIADDVITELKLDTKAVAAKTDAQAEAIFREAIDTTKKRIATKAAVTDGVPPQVSRVEGEVPAITKKNGIAEVISPTDSPIDITKLSKTRREALQVFPEKQTAQGLDELDARTRGTVSWDAAKKAAQELGWTEEKIINFPKGKAFSDTELMATRGVSKQADDTLAVMEARLNTLEKGSEEYVKQSQEITLQRIKAFKLKTVVVGASTEAGRALSSLRSSVDAIDMWERKVAKLFNDPKTPQYLKDHIEKTIADFSGTPQQYAKLLRDAQTSSVLDMLIEFATAVKLTGIPTHIVNTVTGAGMMVMRPIERAMAAAINKGEVLITGTKQQRFFNDAVNDVVGQTLGFRQGAREALNAIKDEEYAWHSRPLDEISLQGPKIKGRPGKNDTIDTVLNVAGKVIRLPFRLLGAEDLMLREPSKLGEMYTAIGRLAIDAGHTPGSKEYAEFFASKLNNPTQEIIEQVSKAADRTTFQSELSPGLSELQHLINNRFKAIKFILPFFKTIVNLQKTAMEYTPVGLVTPGFWRQVKASPETRADALARMALGSFVITPLVFEALDDKITLEAPKNPAERDAFFASGKQAYSIQVGDQWVPFNRLSPFSEWFLTAGLMAKAIKNEDDQSIAELTTNTFFALAANVFDKSFATGMADMLDALRGTEKERQQWLNNFVVGSTLPVLSGNIARSVDPVLRDVNSLKEAYLARIPGLSDNVPARKDVFGKDIQRPGSDLARLLSPVIPSPVTEDLVRTELESLGITMGFPDKKVGGVMMSDEDYRAYQGMAGNVTYDVMSKLIISPQYQNMSPQEKENLMNRTITEVRTAVKAKVATDLVLIKEIQKRLEKSGLTSKQAQEKAPEIFKQLKQQGNQSSQ